MSHGILVQNKVAALNIDSLNRSVICSGSDIDNGFVFNLLTQSTVATSGCEVWVATQIASGSTTDIWMAYEPEVVTTVSGTQKYKGINPDPRAFYNPAGTVFSAFKPQIGDILTMTADSLSSSSKAAYAVATSGTYKLTWGANSVAGLSLRFLSDDYLSIGSGAIDSQRVAAFKFEVVTI
jgi:hypothetical protein